MVSVTLTLRRATFNTSPHRQVTRGESLHKVSDTKFLHCTLMLMALLLYKPARVILKIAILVCVCVCAITLNRHVTVCRRRFNYTTATKTFGVHKLF